uniref:Superoxide dismutase n=1 Tax=Aceria tosichella TaxID=561515 RepID=A0A6G1SI58_9ACAR
MLLIPVVFALLLAGQQQRVVDAWWLFSPEQTTVKPTQTQASSGGQPAVAAAAANGPLKAVAKFDMDGVKGFVKFSQEKPSEPTLIEYELDGLRGNNKLYHVHVRPVPKFDADRVRNNATAIAQLCGDPQTGGHLNPHHVTEKLPPKSAPLDKYEVGDLSGKHGPFSTVPNKPDHYVGSFTDDKLPMSGENSIIGRSVVIHKNTGARWVCASIEPTNY